MTSSTGNDPVVDAVRLTPAISARSDEIEALGGLPPDLVDLIKPTGAFRQWVPAELDGPAVAAWDSLRVIEQYGYADGAVGWCVAIAHHQLVAVRLPAGRVGQVDLRRPRIDHRRIRHAKGSGPTAQRRWARGHRGAGSGGRAPGTAPGSEAGVWWSTPAGSRPLDRPTVSGFRSSTSTATTSRSFPPGRSPGLAGTGSNDYAVDKALVPEGRWVEIGTTTPTFPHPLTDFSFYGLLALAVAATTVGIARRAIDELIALAQDKRPQGSSRSLRERAATQSDVATAEARLLAAWALMESTVGESWDRATTGGEATGGERRPAADGRHPCHPDGGCGDRDDVQGRRGSGGSTEPARSSVAYAMHWWPTQHAMVAPRTMEVAGRHRLGLETDLSLF